jgi:hypothetical protein
MLFVVVETQPVAAQVARCVLAGAQDHTVFQSKHACCRALAFKRSHAFT